MVTPYEPTWMGFAGFFRQGSSYEMDEAAGSFLGSWAEKFLPDTQKNTVLVKSRGPPCPHQALPWICHRDPKDCLVLFVGDSGFLQFFWVVSSDYSKT